MEDNNEELKKDLEEQYAILEEEAKEDQKKKRYLIVFIFFLFIFLGIFGSTFSYIRLYNDINHVEKDDTLLKKLDIVNFEGLLDYKPDVHSYVLEFPKGTTRLDFSYLLGDPSYNIKIEGNDKLKSGINTIKVTVSDDSGREEEYIIYVYIDDDSDVKQQSLNLIDLKVSNHELNKAFKPSVTTYIVNNVLTTESSINVLFKVEDNSVKKRVKINDTLITKPLNNNGNGTYSIDLKIATELALGANKFEITLIDDNGNSKTYYIFINVVEPKSSQTDEPSVIELNVEYLANDGKYYIAEIVPGWVSEEPQVFTVTNGSNYDAYIDIDWTKVVNEFENKEDLEYKLYKGNSVISEGILPSKDSNIIKKVLVPANSTTKYSIKYNYIYREVDQNIDQGKTFSTIVNVSVSQ